MARDGSSEAELAPSLGCESPGDSLASGDCDALADGDPEDDSEGNSDADGEPDGVADGEAEGEVVDPDPPPLPPLPPLPPPGVGVAVGELEPPPPEPPVGVADGDEVGVGVDVGLGEAGFTGGATPGGTAEPDGRSCCQDQPTEPPAGTVRPPTPDDEYVHEARVPSAHHRPHVALAGDVLVQGSSAGASFTRQTKPG
ncbi:hypothetical protein SAMN04489844_0066 [Nocardioides exalbidus]|uniref:Uncharacterized protein n=1 Tax=Nocardioides exalbidus TaxID=402596 RepID=A0A1H4I3E5_9ACTN|nr:hypothetical protein SAMN04489844_0066 [Nocardioides exalbidus]